MSSSFHIVIPDGVELISIRSNNSQETWTVVVKKSYMYNGFPQNSLGAATHRLIGLAAMLAAEDAEKVAKARMERPLPVKKKPLTITLEELGL